METIQPDPIIAELRAVRDGHAALFNCDVRAIFQDIRDMQGDVWTRIRPLSRAPCDENA